MKEEIQERFNYLEDERKKIWKQITNLQDLVNKKTSDYENEAKQSSERATEFKNISEEDKNAISSNLQEANTKLDELRNSYDSFIELKNQIDQFHKSSKKNSETIKNYHDTTQTQKESVQNHVAEIEKIYEGKAALDEKLVRLADIYTKGDDYDTKLATLHKNITDRKKEIDELYYEIFGYTEKNAEGIETQIKGKKDELENSYNLLKANFSETEKAFSVLKEDAITAYQEHVEEKEKIFSERIKQWSDEYSGISARIEGLLPKALTAGLSYAYSEKKEAEIKTSKKLSITFYCAIGGLVLVSLIPFAITIYSLYHNDDNTSVENIILKIPRLVLAILPLYIPVLWVAYSANKKRNLSKRLVEEYTHKEVLSKTFEGLSKQIENIENKDISEDLRIKLLYNILEVNSENPGKLISDYNKSDHPLMDALDKSIKLTNAVTKLAKIPGFSKMAVAIDKKAKDLLEKEGQKANAGIDAIAEGS